MSSATGFVGRRVLFIGIGIGFLMGALLSAAIATFWWRPLVVVELVLLAAMFWWIRADGLLDPDRWEKGFDGEAIVSRTLCRLESFGYELIDDVEIDRGNVDHVVIGPTGVFAIETKSHPGRVEVRDGILRHEGSDRTDFVRQATRGAMAVRGRIGADWVESLLVFPNARLSNGPTRIGTTTVVDLAGLNAFITARPPRLGPDHVQAFAKWIRDDQAGRWLVRLPARIRRRAASS